MGLGIGGRSIFNSLRRVSGDIGASLLLGWPSDDARTLERVSGTSKKEPFRPRPTFVSVPSPPSTPREELEHRIASLQRRLSSQQLDAALIGQNVDLFYFAGSMQSGMLVVPAAGRPIYAVRRVFERATRESALEQIVPFERF